VDIPPESKEYIKRFGLCGVCFFNKYPIQDLLLRLDKKSTTSIINIRVACSVILAHREVNQLGMCKKIEEI